MKDYFFPQKKSRRDLAGLWISSLEGLSCSLGLFPQKGQIVILTPEMVEPLSFFSLIIQPQYEH